MSMKITTRFARFAWPALALATVLTMVGVVPRLGFSRDGAIWSERAAGSAPVATAPAPAWVEIAKTVKPAVVNVSVRGVERKARGDPARSSCSASAGRPSGWSAASAPGS